MLGLQREGKSAAVNRIGIKHFHHNLYGSPISRLYNYLSVCNVLIIRGGNYSALFSQLRQLRVAISRATLPFFRRRIVGEMAQVCRKFVASFRMPKMWSLRAVKPDSQLQAVLSYVQDAP